MKMFGFGRKKTTQSPSTEIPEFISGLPSEVGELSEISEPFDDKDLDDPDLLVSNNYKGERHSLLYNKYNFTRHNIV